jgi:hypothetical protein
LADRVDEVAQVVAVLEKVAILELHDRSLSTIA